MLFLSVRLARNGPREYMPFLISDEDRRELKEDINNTEAVSPTPSEKWKLFMPKQEVDAASDYRRI